MLAVLLVIAVGLITLWQLGLFDRPTDSVATIENNALALDYFDRLRHIQQLVRTQPDHGPGALERAIETGDPDALIRFIKSHFDVTPPVARGRANEAGYIRWGPAGTLRAGTGTPRELAELLAFGLQRMGYETRFVTHAVPDRLRSFERSSVAGEFVRWNDIPDRIAGQALPDVAPVEPQAAFWDHVLNTIPPEALDFDWREFGLEQLPSVQYWRTDTAEQADERRVANLWGADDSPDWSEAYLNTGRAFPEPNIDLAVLAISDSTGLYNPQVLAEARYPQSQLVGTRAQIRFVPAVDSPEALLATPPRDLSMFNAVITISGADNRMDPAQSMVVGETFTSSGRLVQVNESGSVMIGQRTLASGGDPAQVADVSLRDIRTHHYPQLRVRFTAMDGAGESVYGLPISAISARINDQPVSAQLTANSLPSPRIVFLVDTSTSVAPEYRGEATKQLIASIAGAIKEAAPDAQFLPGIIAGNAVFFQWTDDPQQVADRARGFVLESGIWASYADAVETGADAIIVITDGIDVTHEYGETTEMPAEYRPIYERSPPAIVVGFGSEAYPLGPAFQGIADATDGVALDMADSEEAADQIIELLKQRVVPYELWVTAPQGLAGQSATLSLSINVAEDTVSIAVPEGQVIQSPPSLHGLYLRVNTPYGESIRRLAGKPYQARRDASDEEKRNARLGLFGQYTLMMEAGALSPSQILDDAIEARLSWEPVIKAESREAQFEALQGVLPLPSSAFAFSVPVFGAVSGEPLHDIGLRYWLHAEQIRQRNGEEFQVRRVDILPTTRLISSHPDPDIALRDTLTGSALLTELEHAMFDQSSLDELAPPLLLTDRNGLDRERTIGLTELATGWPYYYEFLVNETGPVQAAVGFDPFTGMVLGAMQDGSGGAMTEASVNARFDQVDQLLDMATELGSGSIAAWAEFEKAKMDKLRIATIMIVTMEVPDIEGMIRDAACDRVSGAVDGVIEAGARRIGGDAAIDAIGDAIDVFDEAAEAAGLGGADVSVPIPGCG
ncbi:MAG: vWA domain-containing protein [Pseudomonadota bacterium]